jgi:hypothetical protein
LQEIEQRLVGIEGGTHGIIGQDEFAQRFAEERRVRLHLRRAEACGFRIGIGIERGIVDRAAARPEAGAADLVRIGFVCHRVGQVGHAAGMARRAPWKARAPSGIGDVVSPRGVT